MDVPYYLAIDTIIVTRGGEQRRFYRGDRLDGVHDGTLVSMIRLGQAAENPPAVETIVEDSSESDPVSDWRLSPIRSLDITKNAKAAFAEAGLVTVADALAYGAKHDGLQSINGIGKASEEEFQAAVIAIQPKE